MIILVFDSCSNKKNKTTVPVAKDVVSTPDKPEKGKVYSRSTQNGDYALYIPASYTGNEKYPAIIFLDPHGSGDFPLARYKSLADSFQFMLIGSNNSKNGLSLDQTTQITAELVHEALTELPGNKIILAGFSGGAKAALVSGTSVQGIQGVIYCGAAFPPKSIDVKVPVIGFAGKKDMNYTEVRNFNYSLSGSSSNHALVEWNGKHEWPDSSTFLHAFYWSVLNEMKNNAGVKDPQVIKQYENLISKKINKEPSVLDKANLLQEAISMLDKLTPVSSFEKQLMQIVNSPSYKNAKMQEEKILSAEDRKKELFANSFQDKDMNWWKEQVNTLMHDKNNTSNQRVLGYISLASWSYSSHAVKDNDVIFADKAISIYELADPENSEHAFLKACLLSKNGSPDSAISYLKKSSSLGLNDRSKVDNEPDLAPLHGRNDYQAIVAKMN